MQQFVRALHRRNMRMVTETTALMLLGVLAEAIYFARATADGRPVWQATSLARSEDVHDLIIFALLPPIIFEAGFTMRKRKFFANFVSVMLFAVLGTLAAIIVTGGFLYLMVQAGAVEEVAPLHIPPHPKPPRVDNFYAVDEPQLDQGHKPLTKLTFNQVLLFSSLISSTDPIATLAILKAVKAKPPLYDLIFGESALNDALSIVLFNIFKAACKDESSRTEDDQLPAGQQAARVVGQVAIVLPTSTLLGILFGLASAFATRRLGLHARRSPQIELALLLLFYLACYVVVDSLNVPVLGADGVDLSAIMAVFFCGITMRHYTFHNLSPAARRASVILFRTLAAVSEAALALLLGMAIVDYIPIKLGGRSVWDFGFISLAIVGTLLGRAANIFPMAAVANCTRSRSQRITGAMQTVMWWSGLRGAVSFALAMTLDDSRESHKVFSIETAARIITATLGVIVFSNVVMAPLTRPLIGCLGLGMQKVTAPSPSPATTVETTTDTTQDDDDDGDQNDGARMALSLQQPPTASATRVSLSPSRFREEQWASTAGPDVHGSVGTSPSRFPGASWASTAGLNVDGSIGSAAAAAAVQSTSAAEGESEALVDDDAPKDGEVLTVSGVIAEISSLHRGWRMVDERYLKPIFGGHRRDLVAGEEEDDFASDDD